MNRPTAVAFDAFGTLCDLGARRVSHLHLARALGVPLRALWQHALTHPTAIDFTVALDSAAYARAQEELRVELDSFFLYPDTLPVLTELRHHGIPTALISNVASPYAGLLHDAFDTCIDHLVLSCEVGAAKPDPAIFALAAVRLGRLPYEVLMVGDSLVADVEGARTFGMQALQIARSGAATDGVLERLSLVLARLLE